MPIIETHELYKKYKGAESFSLNQVSLKIEKGEIFGLLGPNGAGKTTLISVLSGLVKPTSGTYLINGLSPAKNLTKIKKIMGIVPQEYALYPTLTARENLLFFGSMYGVTHDVLIKKVDMFLEKLGLLNFADRKVEQFSGGMKRRCNLIAGILHEPELLFLDEPTVGVDVQSRNVIIEFLQELNNNGTSIIYTSHLLNEAEKFCTEIAIIDHGKIFAKGSPKQLISQTENAENLEDVFISLTGKELRDAI